MDRFSKLFCDPVKVVKSIILLALCLGIILYVYFQTISGFDSDVVTETSMLVSLNDSVTADAYIFNCSSNFSTFFSKPESVQKALFPYRFP